MFQPVHRACTGHRTSLDVSAVQLAPPPTVQLKAPSTTASVNPATWATRVPTNHAEVGQLPLDEPKALPLPEQVLH